MPDTDTITAEEQEFKDKFADLGYTFLVVNNMEGKPVYYIQDSKGGQMESFASLDDLANRYIALTESTPAGGTPTPTPTGLPDEPLLHPTPTPTAPGLSTTGVAQGPGNRNVGGGQTYAPGPSSSLAQLQATFQSFGYSLLPGKKGTYELRPLGNPDDEPQKFDSAAEVVAFLSLLTPQEKGPGSINDQLSAAFAKAQQTGDYAEYNALKAASQGAVATTQPSIQDALAAAFAKGQASGDFSEYQSLLAASKAPAQPAQPSIDEQIAAAIAKGDVEGAQRLYDFQNQMTEYQRTQAGIAGRQQALDIAQSPGDWWTYMTRLRGDQPNVPFQLGQRTIPGYAGGLIKAGEPGTPEYQPPTPQALAPRQNALMPPVPPGEDPAAYRARQNADYSGYQAVMPTGGYQAVMPTEGPPLQLGPVYNGSPQGLDAEKAAYAAFQQTPAFTGYEAVTPTGEPDYSGYNATAAKIGAEVNRPIEYADFQNWQRNTGRSGVPTPQDMEAWYNKRKQPIPSFAQGGTMPRMLGQSSFGGGMALVGEKGPELVMLPPGTHVRPISGVTPLAEGTLTPDQEQLRGALSRLADLDAGSEASDPYEYNAVKTRVDILRARGVTLPAPTPAPAPAPPTFTQAPAPMPPAQPPVLAAPPAPASITPPTAAAIQFPAGMPRTPESELAWGRGLGSVFAGGQATRPRILASIGAPPLLSPQTLGNMTPAEQGMYRSEIGNQGFDLGEWDWQQKKFGAGGFAGGTAGAGSYGTGYRGAAPRMLRRGY